MRFVIMCAVVLAAHLSAAEVEPSPYSAFTSDFSTSMAMVSDFAQTELFDSAMKAQEAADDLESMLADVDSLGLTPGIQLFTDDPQTPETIFFTIGIDLSCTDCRITTSSLPTPAIRHQ